MMIIDHFLDISFNNSELSSFKIHKFLFIRNLPWSGPRIRDSTHRSLFYLFFAKLNDNSIADWNYGVPFKLAPMKQ